MDGWHSSPYSCIVHKHTLTFLHTQLSVLTAAAAISASEARKIASLDGAGFTNRFANDKARQGIENFRLIPCSAAACCCHRG